MTTPIDDGDLGSMIQDAVEQAVGQMMPNILDAMVDRFGSGIGGAGRARVDPAQLRQVIDQALSQWQARTPAGIGDQSDLVTAIVEQIGQALVEMDRRTKGRIDRLAEALRQKFAELGESPASGDEWRQFLSQESRDRRLEQMSRERLESQRGPRLERQAGMRDEADQRNYDVAMRSLDIEEKRLDIEHQQGGETNDLLREILTLMREGGRGQGSGDGGEEEEKEKREYPSLSMDKAHSTIASEGREGMELARTSYVGARVLETIEAMQEEGYADQQAVAAIRSVLNRQARVGGMFTIMSGEMGPEQEGRVQQRFEQMQEYAVGQGMNIDPDMLMSLAMEREQRTAMSDIQKAGDIIEPVEPDPRAGFREQAYLASRWTNTAGSIGYGAGAFAAQWGVPGVPQFLGQEASMLRAAGSVGTFMTMMGASAASVIPPLLATTAILGGVAVATISLNKEMEAASKQANRFGQDISTVQDSLSLVTGSTLTMGGTRDVAFLTNRAMQWWEELPDDERTRLREKWRDPAASMVSRGTIQQVFPAVDKVGESVMTMAFLERALAGPDDVNLAAAVQAVMQLSQAESGGAPVISGRVMDALFSGDGERARQARDPVHSAASYRTEGLRSSIGLIQEYQVDYGMSYQEASEYLVNQGKIRGGARGWGRDIIGGFGQEGRILLDLIGADQGNLGRLENSVLLQQGFGGPNATSILGEISQKLGVLISISSRSDGSPR